MMNDLRDDLNQLKKEVQQIKIFCEAVADAHAKNAILKDILHKNIGGLIYRKSQPWSDDLAFLREAVEKFLEAMDYRLKILEEKQQ